MEFCEPDTAVVSLCLLVKVNCEANAMFYSQQVVNQREFHFAEMGNHNTCVFLQVIQWAFREKILGVEDVGQIVKISGLDSSSPFRDSVANLWGEWRGLHYATNTF